MGLSVDLHKPKVVGSHEFGGVHGFVTVDLAPARKGQTGRVTLFFKDWAAWDKLVADVERRRHA